MRNLVLVAALSVTLAACGDAAEEADDTAAVETPAATEAVAAETSAGTYEFEMDGVATVAVLNPDGTYTDTQDGEVIETGTWEDRDDGTACFDSEGGDDTVVCYTLSEAAEDGTQTATPDDGSETLTVRKVS
jgi:hypothetical protein